MGSKRHHTILSHPTHILDMNSYMSPSGSIYIYGDFFPSVAFLQHNYCAFIRKYDTNGCLTPECQNILFHPQRKNIKSLNKIIIFHRCVSKPNDVIVLYVSIQDPNESNYGLQLINMDGHIVYEGLGKRVINNRNRYITSQLKVRIYFKP